jgi:hypothetical protein
MAAKGFGHDRCMSRFRSGAAPAGGRRSPTPSSPRGVPGALATGWLGATFEIEPLPPPMLVAFSSRGRC